MHTDKVNRISKHRLFRETSLYDEFKTGPISFYDIGAAGGIHHMILPVADIVNCIMFEPNSDSLSTAHPATCDVKQMMKETAFNEVKIINSAVSDTNGVAELNITANQVSSSFLGIDEDFIKRYKNYGFRVVDKCTARTQTLDTIADQISTSSSNVCEIMKIDCQGMEKKILLGASQLLNSRCLAILTEVSFTECYQNQPTFADIDLYLKSKGFILYGLYSKYISAKHMDRMQYCTNEKLFEADALYFKDPLHKINSNSAFDSRKIHLLIIFALLFDYFDYAIELINKYMSEERDGRYLVKLIESLSTIKTKKLIEKTDKLIQKCSNNPDKSFIYAQQYIDDNRGNSSIEFLDDL